VLDEQVDQGGWHHCERNYKRTMKRFSLKPQGSTPKAKHMQGERDNFKKGGVGVKKGGERTQGEGGCVTGECS